MENQNKCTHFFAERKTLQQFNEMQNRLVLRWGTTKVLGQMFESKTEKTKEK